MRLRGSVWSLVAVYSSLAASLSAVIAFGMFMDNLSSFFINTEDSKLLAIGQVTQGIGLLEFFYFWLLYRVPTLIIILQ